MRLSLRASNNSQSGLELVRPPLLVGAILAPGWTGFEDILERSREHLAPNVGTRVVHEVLFNLGSSGRGVRGSSERHSEQLKTWRDIKRQIDNQLSSQRR